MKRFARIGRKRHHQRTRGAVRAAGAGLPRVLVVDDNVLNIELVKYVMGTGHCRVEAAPDAERARSLIAAFEPHLILMDIQLPGMNGLELTRLIKADPATHDIIVLAFTAYAMQGDEAKMRAAGCDGYITKPIQVATFAADVLAFLGPFDAGKKIA
jgi:two-component system cell cycle response regulator DivK